MRKALLLTLLVLAGCATPNPASSPLRLPTRAPAMPTPPPSPTPIDVRTFYEAGQAHREAGDAEAALQSFTRAIQLSPTFAPAYVARGAVFLSQGELDLALADADAALEIDPTDALAHALRGEALRLLNRRYLALEAFDRAIDLDPTLMPDIFSSRWLAARGVHDSDRLLELSREYAVTHPDDPLRYYYRGWAFIEQGNAPGAVSILKGGIEATPSPPAVLWFALGYAYSETKSWAEALTCFEVTRTLVQTGDASIAFHSDQPIADLFGALGLAYLGVGRCADAESMLDYAIAVGAPASEFAFVMEEIYLCQNPTPSPTPYPYYESRPGRPRR